MSAHYHYPELPARKLPGTARRWGDYNLLDNPEDYQCTLLGSIHLGFVHGSERLCVWQCNISKIVFFYEMTSSEESDLLQLVEKKHLYNGFTWDYKENCKVPAAPCFNLVFPEKLEQFKHFVMGWKPSVWDYNGQERLDLCAALDKAFNNG